MVTVSVTLGQVNYGGTIISGINPSAIGTNSVAEGHSAFAAGFASQATASYTTSLGFYSFATYTGAISIGKMVKANGQNSIIIGSGGPWNEGIFLENNMPRSLMIGFESTHPTLFVGESPNTSGFFNQTGKVAIGNVINSEGYIDPQTKLHIRSDNNEEAAIFIEPNRWDESARASLFLGNMNHGITSSGTAGLVFHTQSYYFLNEGNVGIGLENNLPETKLEVGGTVKMTGLRLFNQSSRPGYVLTCSDLNGEARWQDPTELSIWKINEENEAYRLSNVGIGVENPSEKLEIDGNLKVLNAVIGTNLSDRGDWFDSEFLTLKGSDSENASKIMLCKGYCGERNPLKIINPIGEIQFTSYGKIIFNLRESEAVFGRPDELGYELKVNGKLWAHEVEVRVLDWWDEVFNDDYELMPISKLENYIVSNKRLPGFPSEEEVHNNGIGLGEMNSLLLKKVEELTLYIIEQQKQIDQLKLNLK